MGFGFFIPVFFVTSGVRYDLHALLADASNLAMLPIFLAALVVVRGLPALLYRRVLDPGEWWSRLDAGHLASLHRGRHRDRARARAGRRRGERALIGAGLLSVLVFPLLG